MLKYSILTHDDLDGVTAGFLLMKAHGREVDIVATSYDKLDTWINTLRHTATPDTYLLIADLSLTDEQYEILSEAYDGKMRTFDHHKTSKKRKEWDLIDLSKSATKIIYEEYKDRLNDSPNLKELVEIVNSLDMWLEDRDLGKDMARICHKAPYRIMGIFLNEYESPEPDYLKSFNDLCRQEVLFMEEEERQALKDIKTYKPIVIIPGFAQYSFGLVYADKHIQAIGEHLLDKGYDVAVIVSPNRGQVSLRSRGDIDVSVIAKSNCGGGHKNASGFPIDYGINLKEFWIR